jgi:hypothetical protein
MPASEPETTEHEQREGGLAVAVSESPKRWGLWTILSKVAAVETRTRFYVLYLSLCLLSSLFFNSDGRNDSRRGCSRAVNRTCTDIPLRKGMHVQMQL